MAPDLSDRGSHCFQLRIVEGTRTLVLPLNEAEGQNIASVSRTKLLENGRGSETSTARESSTDVDVDNVDLEISSFWLHDAWFQKMFGEQRSLN